MVHTQRTICLTHHSQTRLFLWSRSQIVQSGDFRAALCRSLTRSVWSSSLALAVLVHLRVIVYQLAVHCKPRRRYESQSRQLKNEGEKIFRASRGRISYYCLWQSPYHYKILSYVPARYVHPFTIARSAPAGRDVWAW